MNYVELQKSVAEIIGRSNFANTIPLWIKQAQLHLEDTLRFPFLKYLATSTTNMTADTNTIALPTDFLELIHLTFYPDRIAPPSGPTVATSGTGLTGTYYYRVTATDAFGETDSPTANVSNSIVVTNQGVLVTWTAAQFATGYKVYRCASATATSGTLVATITDSATLTYTDSGGGTTASWPTVNQSGSYRNEPVSYYDSRYMRVADTSVSKTGTGLPSSIEIDKNRGVIITDVYAKYPYVYELEYYRRLPQLSLSASTNGWTDNEESLLLYAVLNESIPYLADDPRINVWKNTLEEKITAARRKYKRMVLENNLPFGSPNVVFIR